MQKTYTLHMDFLFVNVTFNRYAVLNIEVHGYRKEYPQAKSLYERLVVNSMKGLFGKIMEENPEIEDAVNFVPLNLGDSVGKAFLGTYHEQTVTAEATYGYDIEK